MSDVTPNHAARFLQKVGIVLFLGFAAAVLYALIDVARFGRGMGLAEFAVATSLAAAVCVPAAFVLAILVFVIFLVTGTRVNDKDWLGVMTGMAVLGPGVTASLVVNPEGSGLTRPILGFVSILTAIFCGSLARRRSWNPIGRRALSLAVMPVIAIVAAALWRAVPGKALSAPVARAASHAAPNVVLIVLDTTRRDRFGVYGHKGDLTPVMDGFAENAVVYDQAISTAPWTVPSHASMFTGLYPCSHGCSYEHHVWLDDSFDTLQEILAGVGYQTLALCANFWVEESNILQGFQEVVSLEGVYDLLATRRLALALGWPTRWVDKGADEGVDALGVWFRERHEPSKPTFLFLNLFEAHVEYVPPTATRDTLEATGVELRAALSHARNYNPCLTNIKRLNDPELARSLSALYDAEIRYQDRRLGDFLELIRAHLPSENTLVIVTSDHGENLGEAGRWEHLFAINDLLLQIPLLIRFPEGLGGGTRIPGICQTVDLFTTILAAAGLHEHMKDLPGGDLHPDRFEAREAAFAQVSPFYPYLHYVEKGRGVSAGMGDFVAHYRTIRTEHYKFVWSSIGKHGLYELGNDALETNNLIQREPERAADLHAKLMAFWKDQPKYQRQAKDVTTAPMDKRVIERLRSLGYVE